MDKSRCNVNDQGARAILPLLIFILAFMGGGVSCAILGYEKPFLQIPACIAAYVALLSAFFLLRGTSTEKFQWVLEGIGRPNIAVLLCVLALAGGFSEVSESCGSVDALVELCLAHVPPSIITVCFFFAGCLISFASGSSLTAIVAIGPIILRIAKDAGISASLAVGCVMGAAMFGNSISPISDCTIISNNVMGLQSEGAARQKLFTQLKLYAIPIVLTTGLLAIFGRPQGNVTYIVNTSTNFWSVLPYAAVLILAMTKVNFVLTLSAGIFLSVGIGVVCKQFDLVEAAQIVASGMFQTANMLLLFVFMAAVIHMVSKAGGIDWIVQKLTSMIHSAKSAQVVIWLLGVILTCCVSNDTIPMITMGDVAKDLSREYRVDPRRTAILLPVATAGTAVLIPYSGVSLTMSSLIENAEFHIVQSQSVPYNWFVLLAFLMTFITIICPFTDTILQKDPWNYETWAPQSASK